MKIRTGFVSNSSSTSFLCPICKELFVGWDEEYGVDTVTCEICGSTMCREHTDWDEYGYIPEEHCPVCTLKVIEDNLVLAHLLNVHGYKREDVEKNLRMTYKSHKELVRGVK